MTKEGFISGQQAAGSALLRAQLREAKAFTVPQREGDSPLPGGNLAPSTSRLPFPTFVAGRGSVGPTYLQQEPRALGHERERHHRGDAGQCADNDENAPAVELVGRAHAEAPPWERRTGRVRQAPPDGPWGKALVGVCTCTFLVKANYRKVIDQPQY